jgi:hypothetical protein
MEGEGERPPGPGKGRSRRVLWPVAGLAALGLAWGAGVLYVHWTVRRDVAALRGVRADPTRVLLHGCRALPALVAELDPEADAKRLELLSTLILAAVYQSHSFEAGSPNALRVIGDLSPLQVTRGDSAEERRRKCRALRAWWRERAGEYHQAWRFWSAACRAPLARDF